MDVKKIFFILSQVGFQMFLQLFIVCDTSSKHVLGTQWYFSEQLHILRNKALRRERVKHKLYLARSPAEFISLQGKLLYR